MNGLIEPEGADRSERYCNDLRLRLGRLCVVFEDKTVEQISTADLEGFLASLNVAAEARNTFRQDIRTLWSFAEKRGWATATTAKNTERAKAIDRPPWHSHARRGRRIAHRVQAQRFLAFHAIGLFAGQFAMIHNAVQRASEKLIVKEL